MNSELFMSNSNDYYLPSNELIAGMRSPNFGRLAKTSSDLSLSKQNGNLVQLNSVSTSTVPLNRRFSVSSMSQSETVRTPAAFLNQFPPTKLPPPQEEQEELAAPDMILKHGKISGLTWWCTFKDSQLERLYRKFFYLDAHFHFQFLGLANIVWDILQILTFFFLQKYQYVESPIKMSTYNGYICRSTFCNSPRPENFTNCDSFLSDSLQEAHILTPDERSYALYHFGALPRLIIHFISLIVFVSLAILWQFDRHPPTRRRRAYAILLWFLLCSINYTLFAISPSRVPDDEVGFTQFIIFMTYTLIPVPLFWSLGLAVFLSIFHIFLITIVTVTHPHIEQMIESGLIATLIILIAANLNGFYHNTLYELSARRIFLIIRDSAKTCIMLNNEHEKMKYLLLSIMPKYFYDKYEFGVKDKNERISNFKKLHVDHVEQVSILFADIVGFTKISSSMEPKELVAMLNRLFGEFDELAKRNNCLRIKILGDCYYCVSGVPDRLESHADNCVNMGLDMCETIKKFQSNTFPELKMRVGVHSGNVFSGILGAKKLQFDIWSTDVTIANHMESSGVPGCVHISHVTKEFLVSPYQMDSGNGADRDNLLQHNNIATYLIRPEEHKKAKSLRFYSFSFRASAVPFSKQSIDLVRKCSPSDTGAENPSADRLVDRRSTTDSMATEIEYNMDKQIKHEIEESLIKSKKKKNDLEEDEQKVEHFSISNTHSHLNPIFLIFTDRKLEIKYLNLPDKSFKYYIISSWIVHVAIFLVQMIVHTSELPIYFFVSVSIFLAILDSIYWMYLLEYIEHVPLKLEKIKKYLAMFSNWMIRNIYMRYAVSLVVIVLVMVSANINLLSCCPVGNDKFRHRLCNDSLPLPTVFDECDQFIEYFSTSRTDSCIKCSNPQYFVYNAILAMLVPSMFIGLNWFYKAVINSIGFIVYVTIHIHHSAIFDQWDYRHSGICTPRGAYISLIERGVYWILIEFLALVMFERLIERTNRIGFIWRYLSKEKNDLHKKANEEHINLLHNILPKHVAQYFLRDDQKGHYSNKHPNACVMFASIPDFETIYSEDDINHQGKEWLRLLNEMFHEFDMLLEYTEFEGVEKIKTIGSTYMAVTGLSEEGTSDDDDEHIITMAKFTFALRDKLKELSDNALNDYQFRIGINTGPVVAGVIGAEKPLFDIWGDTVNVASRMESTGEVGKTQVTEKVAHVLRKELFVLKPRGKVFCKGKGELDVFILDTPTS